MDEVVKSPPMGAMMTSYEEVIMIDRQAVTGGTARSCYRKYDLVYKEIT